MYTYTIMNLEFSKLIKNYKRGKLTLSDLYNNRVEKIKRGFLTQDLYKKQIKELNKLSDIELLKDIRTEERKERNILIREKNTRVINKKKIEYTAPTTKRYRTGLFLSRFNKKYMEEKYNITLKEFHLILKNKVNKIRAEHGNYPVNIHMQFQQNYYNDTVLRVVKYSENFDIFNERIEDIKNNPGPGSDPVGTESVPSFQYFRIDLLSNGPNRDGIRGGKDEKTFKSKYLKVKNFASKNNNCFFAPIKYILKDNVKIKSFRSRMEKHGLKEGEKFDMKYIELAQKEYKINVNVHIQASEKEKPFLYYKSLFKFDKTCDLLLMNEHFQLIIGKKVFNKNLVMREKKRLTKQELKQKKTDDDIKNKLKELYLVWDCETIFHKTDIKMLEVYSASWMVHNPKDDFNYFEQYKELINKLVKEGKKEDEINKILDADYKNNKNYKNCYFSTKDPIKEFLDFILNCPEGYKYKIIGYNSSRFDNFFLFDKASDLEVLNTNNFIYVNNSILQMGIDRHTVFDLCRFLACDLKSACKDFNTCPKKIEGFSHDEIQAYYEEGLLNKFIKKNRNKIEKYNKYDVISLLDLVLKVRKAVLTLTKENITDYLTIGHMGFKIFDKQTSTFMKVEGHLKKFTIIPAPKTQEDDKFIRRALVAGRTQCYFKRLNFKYKNKLKMVDAKSLYPYVLLNNIYPIGEYKKTSSYIEDKLGIYKCKILHQNMKWVNKDRMKFNYIDDRNKSLSFHSDYAPVVVPKRSEKITESLDWTHRGEMELNLTSIDIECIRRNGGEVEVYNGFYWDNSSKDIFTKFLKPFQIEKTKQDTLKGTTEYNNALREMCKLFSNCISGKIIQRNFEDVFNIIKTPLELEIFKNKTKPETIEYALGSKFVIGKGKLKDDEIYDASRAKPSYLGVFCYSYAREYMYETVLNKYLTFYQDTDSACLPVEEYERFLKENKEVNITMAGQYGAFEEELGNNGGSEIITIAPKCYMVDTDGCKDKRKFKGIRKNDTYFTLNEMREKGYTIREKMNKNTKKVYYNNDIPESEIRKLSKLGHKTMSNKMFQDLYKKEKLCIFQSQLRKMLDIGNGKEEKATLKVVQMFLMKIV